MNNINDTKIFKLNKKFAKKNLEYVPIILVVNGINVKLAKKITLNHKKGRLSDLTFIS